MISNQDLDIIKRKIRKLKKYEKEIRFPQENNEKSRLIWNDFFDLHEKPASKSKYTINMIASMNSEEYENMLSEYFSMLFGTLYSQNQMTSSKIYNQEALSFLSLPLDSDERDIKKRFRELASKHHPDAGGSAEKFIELMAVYKKLI